MQRNARKGTSKIRISNAIERARLNMVRLCQDPGKQMLEIKKEIDNELVSANRGSLNPWYELFSISKQKAAKKPGKNWIDATHH